MKKLLLLPLVLLYQHLFSQYYGVGTRMDADINNTRNPIKIAIMGKGFGKNIEAVLMSVDSTTKTKTAHIFKGIDLKSVCIKSRIYTSVEQTKKMVDFFNKDCVMITHTNWKKCTDNIIYNIELKTTDTNIAVTFFEITQID